MKKNIMVVFDGISPEYKVSLNSAFSVIENLKDYNVIKTGVTEDGHFYLFEGEISLIKEDNWQKSTKELTVNLSSKCFICDNKKVEIDLIIPMIHGESGEDGTIQALGKILDIPVLGAGILSSALCLDKYRSHLLAKAAGIKTAESTLITNGKDIDSAGIKYPVFVKPVHAGSSFGISKVYKKEDMKNAIEDALRYDEEVMIEEFIDGFEVGVSVIGNMKLTTGEVDEIEVNSEFFDYEEKYNLTNSIIHLPARIDNHLKQQIINTAIKLYRLFEIKDYARIDLFITADNEIFFNEINTIPGFTEHSRFPRMMEAKGLNLKDLLTRMIKEKLC